VPGHQPIERIVISTMSALEQAEGGLAAERYRGSLIPDP
jgi:hypothetical protein